MSIQFGENCIYAKNLVFRLLSEISITPCSCQNYPMNNFDRINEFVVLYELEK